MKNFITGVSLLAASAAFGAQMTPEQMVEAGSLAVDMAFSNNPEIKDSFTGYKVWRLDDNTRVRVYFGSSDAPQSVDFTCMDHGSEIMCHDM